MYLLERANTRPFTIFTHTHNTHLMIHLKNEPLGVQAKICVHHICGGICKIWDDPLEDYQNLGESALNMTIQHNFLWLTASSYIISWLKMTNVTIFHYIIIDISYAQLELRKGPYLQWGRGWETYIFCDWGP